MDKDTFDQVNALATRRNSIYYAWLRNLLLIASGALTLLVSLQTGSNSGIVAQWCLRAAWISLGLGILLLASALHGEVWTARDLMNKTAAKIGQREFRSGPVVSGMPEFYRTAAKAAYLCLATAVTALVLFGVLR